MKKLRLIASALAAALMITLLCGVAWAAPAPFDDSAYDVRAYVLIDAETGKILAGKNETERNEPASTTKIMSLIVALESGDVNREITVGAEVNVTAGSSVMGLKEGETLPLKDLLYGMMLPSGNDAARATSVAVGGTLDGFVELMNAKAAEMGLAGTHFVNAHGLHDDEHYTTAWDMAQMAKYAYANADFRQIVGTQEYTTAATNKHANGLTIKNTNKLIVNEPDNEYYYSYATGIKTGSTPYALRCLVGAAEKDGMSLICVIFGDGTDEGTQRWPLARELFEYGFNNFQRIDLTFLLEGAQSVNAQVKNASLSDEGAGYLELLPVIGSDGSLQNMLTADEVTAINAGSYEKLQTIDDLTAPIAEGDVCGKVSYLVNGEEFFEINLVASREVKDLDTTEVQATEPVRTQEVVTVENIPEKEISPWWWLLIPGVLALIFVIRVAYVSKKRRKRARGRSNYYHIK